MAGRCRRTPPPPPSPLPLVELHQAPPSNSPLLPHIVRANCTPHAFQELKLHQKGSVGKTAKGSFSTDEATLKKLLSAHPLPRLVLEYRQIAKLQSTYLDGMLSHVRHGRIHPRWLQTSTATGRLACETPNLQNVPAASLTVELVQRAALAGQADRVETAVVNTRAGFKPPAEHVFLSADWSQIELRVLAHVCGDQSLVKVFQDTSRDFFKSLASQWRGIPVAEVTALQRDETKRVVYGIVYGIGPAALAEQLGVTPSAAQSMNSSFMKRFPAIGQFQRRCIRTCREKGFLRTLTDRRRSYPDISSPNFAARAHAERSATNFVIQGTAADICKMALLECCSRLVAQPQLRARLILQVHDELIWGMSLPNRFVLQRHPAMGLVSPIRWTWTAAQARARCLVSLIRRGPSRRLGCRGEARPVQHGDGHRAQSAAEGEPQGRRRLGKHGVDVAEGRTVPLAACFERMAPASFLLGLNTGSGISAAFRCLGSLGDTASSCAKECHFEHVYARGGARAVVPSTALAQDGSSPIGHRTGQRGEPQRTAPRQQ